MAYKFQRGTARMSGALQQEGNITVNDADQESIGIESTLGSGNFLVQMKYDSGAESGFLQVNSGSGDVNFQVDQIFSGSAFDTLANNGLAFDQANGTMDLDINGLTNTLTAVAQADLIALSDNSDSNEVKKITFTNFEDQIFANVSGDATIAAGGALTIAAGAVENSMLDNSSINLSNGVGIAAIGNISLGGTGSIAVDGVLEDLDQLGAATADGEFIVATGAGAFAYESGNVARTSLGLGTGDSPTFTNLTLSGDLTVNGTQTILNTTTLEVEDKNIFIASGSANAAAADGAGLTVDGADIQWKYGQNGVNDGTHDATSSGDIWMASGSSGLIDIQAAAFYGDGSNLTGVSATGVSLTAQSLSSTGNITGKLVLLDSSGGSFIATLPAVASNIGELYVIKDSTGDCASNPITIEGNGSETIDGELNILLESGFAAVSLFGTSGGWIIV